MILQYILGEARLSFSLQDRRRVFSVLSREDVAFRDMKSEEESFSFLVPLYRKKKLSEAFEKEGVEVKAGEWRGLPAVLYRYRKRPGIAIGILIIALLVWLSGRVIWCVNVTGNTTVSDGEIIALLEKLGCGVGDTYGDIDFDMLHNQFLLESDNIAWIAVNMNGTHANVEVREIKNGEEKKGDGGFYNIVAGEDGSIERIAATEGKPVVEIGETVRKGELLISGAITYKEIFNRYESADGSVYARVKRSFKVSVPYESEEKVYTGEKEEKKTLRFFKFDINLFVNSSNSYEFYDTITMNNQVLLFDTVALPLYVKTTEYREYKKEQVTLTESEARERATALYREKLCETLGDATLLSKTVKEKAESKAYTIECDLWCLADIAKKVPLRLQARENRDKE